MWESSVCLNHLNLQETASFLHISPWQELVLSRYWEMYCFLGSHFPLKLCTPEEAHASFMVTQLSVTGICVHACSVVSDSVTLWTIATRLLCPWDSPGKNTGVGCHFLLQGIFPTQGSDPSLASSALAGASLSLSHLGSHD